MAETLLRTVVRSATWRVGGVLLAALLTYALTGNLALSFELGLAYNAIRFVSFIAHERAWARVRWGLTPTRRP